MTAALIASLVIDHFGWFRMAGEYVAFTLIFQF